jgi:hypothetical protein
MYPKILHNLNVVIIISVAGLAVMVTPVHAQTYLSGTYTCVKVEIAGKAQACSAPSIELNSDGSYEILAEHGTYAIVGGRWLVLSTSKNHGKARLGGDKEIFFEFVSGGKKSTIIYRQKYQRPPAWVSS